MKAFLLTISFQYLTQSSHFKNLVFSCTFPCSFPILIFPPVFPLEFACWATALFLQDTLTFAQRPRKWTTWQSRQNCGVSSVTLATISTSPVMITLSTTTSPRSRASLVWLVESLLVSREQNRAFQYPLCGSNTGHFSLLDLFIVIGNYLPEHLPLL